MNVSVVNIREFLEADDKEFGKSTLDELIEGFSCKKNKDVESFLKNSAIEFTKKNQSVTFLVLDSDDAQLLGYFSLAVKPIIIRISKDSKEISNSMRRRIERVSKFDEESTSYMLSAYLIAQLGKNFTDGVDKRISGSDLLQLAVNKIKEVQYIIGGMVVFLEAEMIDELDKFYRSENGFVQFGTRKAESPNDEHDLIQMLKILR